MKGGIQMERLQVIPTTQDELSRIADSLSPVNFSGISVIVALVVFILTFIIARIARRTVRRYGAQIDFISPAAVDAVARFSSYVVVISGIFASLNVVGIDLLPLFSGLGILFVVAAFGLRSFLDNFAAGLSLRIERPIELGDHVKIHGIEGRVDAISARTVRLTTMDGKRVFVPNREVLDQPIVNYSAEGRRRSIIDVGLSYDSDLESASMLMTEAAASAQGVLADPPPEVFVHEFDDSTIKARVRFWHPPDIPSTWEVRHQVALAVKRVLNEHGIEIAFPHRVLSWVDADGVDPLGRASDL